MRKIKDKWRPPLAILIAALLALFPGMRRAEAQDPDDRAWILASTAKTREAYQEYLDQYPIGRHAAAAFACLVAEARGINFCDPIEPAAGPGGGGGGGGAGIAVGLGVALY